MFDTSIIGSVYRKEFREFTQDTRTLLIVFLIPLLFIPIITLTTYSVNIEAEQVMTSNALISSQCEAVPLDVSSGSQCYPQAEKTALLAKLNRAELSAVLDMTSDTLYLANEDLMGEQAIRSLVQDYMRLTYVDKPNLKIEDLESDASIVSVIGTSLANVLVMLIITFSFVGALNFGIDVTTGEKERGSFKLYAEFKDKIFSIFAGKLAFTSLCSGLSAVLGVLGITISILAIEFFYGDTSSLSQTEVDKVGAFIHYIQMLTTEDLLVVMLYLLPCIVVISSLVNLFGCLAKNMKEAKLLGLVLMIIIVALTKVDLGEDNFFYTAFIPVLNVFAGVNNSLTLHVDYSHLAVSMLVNFLVCINNLFDIKKLIVKEII
jgi:sodium transport system permease protein